MREATSPFFSPSVLPRMTKNVKMKLILLQISHMDQELALHMYEKKSCLFIIIVYNVDKRQIQCYANILGNQ